MLPKQTSRRSTKKLQQSDHIRRLRCINSLYTEDGPWPVYFEIEEFLPFPAKRDPFKDPPENKGLPAALVVENFSKIHLTNQQCIFIHVNVYLYTDTRLSIGHVLRIG